MKRSWPSIHVRLLNGTRWETAEFGHEAKLARLGLHPLADDGGCARTLLDGRA